MNIVKEQRSPSSNPVAALLASARCAVGAVMILKPEVAEAKDQPMRLLVQTIGIRDVVVGGGTLLQLRRNGNVASLWTWAGLASDLADTVLAAVSFRALGRRAGLIALLAPVPFIAAGRYALSGRAR